MIFNTLTNNKNNKFNLIINNDKQQSTFLFHDYKTFKTHPTLNHPTQFTTIHTDNEFNIIDEPEIFYYKPTNNYLPQPKTILITDITPQKTQTKKKNETTFTTHIHSLFTVPKTYILNYNNIHFDDKITHNIFYRNFYNPYT